MSEAAAKKAPKKAKAGSKKTASGEIRNAYYDVIQAPVITEKSTMASEQNKVVFHINPSASKADVKSAVEALFGVKVLKVNTINIRGKKKYFRGRLGHRSDTRKVS